MKRYRKDTGSCPRCGYPITAILKKGEKGSSFHFGWPVVYDPGAESMNCTCMICGVRYYRDAKWVQTDSDEVETIKDLWESAMAGSDEDEDKEMEILQDLGTEFGFEPKKKKKGFVRTFLKKVVVDSTSDSIKSLARDANGILDFSRPVPNIEEESDG